mmetsp:Transcript_15615/g.33927  ORF Transcript_15615/g.33927 Transcript_15615/m.33927 type:complete len:468 (-) Transcript_15615:287-1690(-)
MLPQASKKWYHSYDAFRSIPKELAEGTTGGALMTLVAIAVCVVLFVCETVAFLTSKPSTQVVIDSNTDSLLRINFDVEMIDINCDHVTVGVWDAFGTEKMNVSANVQKQRIDHKGSRKGTPYSMDEIAELEFTNVKHSKEEEEELDSDWGSSSDHFKHDDFQGVIDLKQFTFINFYADWCGHCRQFSPTWKKFEEAVRSPEFEAKDADGQVASVHALKINCVDFEEACVQQKIKSFPNLRLYRRGDKPGHWLDFKGSRTEEGLKMWLKQEVEKVHTHTNATFHQFFPEGCRLSGFVEAQRVPGTVHFQAVHTDERELNLAYTNVSHIVHHFSFGEAPRRSINALPTEYKRHVNPLDGRSFVTTNFHEAPQHYIKVVHTKFEDRSLRSYQQTHQWSIRRVSRSKVPQAKFSYDLAPVEVIVRKGDKRWYDYLTQVLAIIGGAFSVMSMLIGVAKATHHQVKRALGKTL